MYQQPSALIFLGMVSYAFGAFLSAAGPMSRLFNRRSIQGAVYTLALIMFGLLLMAIGASWNAQLIMENGLQPLR